MWDILKCIYFSVEDRDWIDLKRLIYIYIAYNARNLITVTVAWILTESTVSAEIHVISFFFIFFVTEKCCTISFDGADIILMFMMFKLNIKAKFIAP